MFAGRLTAIGPKQAKGKANRRNAVRLQRGIVFPIKLLLLGVLLAGMPLRVQSAGAVPSLILQFPMIYASFTLTMHGIDNDMRDLRDFIDQTAAQCHEEFLEGGAHSFICHRYVKECDIANQRFRVSVPKRKMVKTRLNESENRYYGEVEYKVEFVTMEDCVETYGNCDRAPISGHCFPKTWWRKGEKVIFEGSAKLKESDQQRADRIKRDSRASDMANQVNRDIRKADLAIAAKAVKRAQTLNDVFTGTTVNHNGETYVVKIRFSNAFIAEIMGVPISQVREMPNRKKSIIIPLKLLRVMLDGKKIPKGVKVKIKKVKR